MSNTVNLLSSIYPANIVIHVGEAVSALDGLTIGRLDLISPAPVTTATNLPEKANVAETVRHQALIAGTNAKTDYITANLALESSTLKPDLLTPYWRNIREVSRRTIKAVTIDGFLEDHAPWSAEPRGKWLIISCLPGSGILAGADTALTTTDVLVLRGFADQPDAPALEAEYQGALRSQCKKAGFIFVAAIPERNPAFVRLVFTRNWRALAAELEADRDEQKRCLETETAQAEENEKEASAQIATLRTDQDEQRQRLETELEEQKQRLEAERDGQKQQLKAELNEQKQRLEAELNGQKQQLKAETARAEESEKKIAVELKAQEEELREELKLARKREQLCKNNLLHMRQKHRRAADVINDRDQRLASLKTILERIRAANAPDITDAGERSAPAKAPRATTKPRQKRTST